MTEQEELDNELIKSAFDGDFNKVKLLIGQGADIHVQDDYALMYSAKNGHLDIIKYLVEHGANIHAYMMKH
jgi:ankyrin repeat protein